MNASATSLLSTINAVRSSSTVAQTTILIEHLTQTLLDMVKVSPHETEFKVPYHYRFDDEVRKLILQHFATEQIKVAIFPDAFIFTLPQFSLTEAIFGAKPVESKTVPEVKPVEKKTVPEINPVEKKPVPEVKPVESKPVPEIKPDEKKPAFKHFPDRPVFGQPSKPAAEEKPASKHFPGFVAMPNPSEQAQFQRLGSYVVPRHNERSVYEQLLEDERDAQFNKIRLEKELNRSAHVRDPLIDLLNNQKFIAGWHDVSKIVMTDGKDDAIYVFAGFAVADAEQKAKTSRSAFNQAQEEWKAACAKQPEISKVCDVYVKYKRSKLIHDMNTFYQRLVTLLENSEEKKVVNTYYDGGNKNKLPLEAMNLIAHRLVELGHGVMFHTSFTLNKNSQRENWVVHVNYRRPSARDLKE